MEKKGAQVFPGVSVIALMDSPRPLPAGLLTSTLIDHDIAHIRRVMPLSLRGDLAGPILPADYWRKRLHRLLDTGHVSKAQLCEIDSLLLQLDHYDLQYENAAPRIQAAGGAAV